MADGKTFTDEEIAEIMKLLDATRRTQYVGARYVPILGRKGETSIEWDGTAPYEPLTIVLHQGNSYTARQRVPAGVDITDGQYWAETGNYNAQIEQYRQDVLRYDARITTAQTGADAANDKLAAMGVHTAGDGAEMLHKIDDMGANVTSNQSMLEAMGITDVAGAESFNGVPQKISNVKIVNVMDKGATGDGVTDDTEAFESAISSAANGVVYIPRGTYSVKANMLNAENIAIIGAGNDSVIKNTEDTSAPIIKVGSNTSIKNLSFDINKFSFFVDVPDSAENITMEECKGIAGKIIRTIGRQNEDKTAKNITVKNCTAENWAGGTADGAILLAYTRDSSVTGCMLVNAVQACSGIVVYGGDSAKKSISDDNNKCGNIIITNNIVSNVEGGCIWGSLCKDVIVSHNIVSDSLDVGIDFEGSLRCVADSNDIADCRNANIALINNTKECAIFNNNSIMNETPADNHYKYHFMAYKNGLSTGDNYVIKGNNFITTNNSIMCQVGNVSQIANATISGNRFSNTYVNVSNGSAALNCVIDGNQFNNTLDTNYSIESNDCTDSGIVKISNNTFNDRKSISIKTVQNFNGRGVNSIENNLIKGEISISAGSDSGVNAVIVFYGNTLYQSAALSNTNALSYMWFEDNRQMAVSGINVRRAIPYPNTQPESGNYFTGQKIYYITPTDSIGIVATKNGSSPEWKKFGTITQ